MASLAAATPRFRQVLVERLSVRNELANVFRLSVTVVLGVWLYLASGAGASPGARRNLLPYQALIENQSATEQRVFRELQEGLLEAEGLRSTEHAWPAIDTLAREGIPPFATDPTARAAYQWTLLRDGNYINYLGVPAQPNVPAWLVLIQEPDKGTVPDQNFEDEEHHRLLDGTMLHVSTWKRPPGVAAAGAIVRLPQAEGWTQLYAVGPGRLTPQTNGL